MIKHIKQSSLFRNTQNPYANILVVGIPNVGKSSLINILRNNHLSIKGHAAKVGNLPGVTRSVMTKIRVSDQPNVFIVDTPGILTPTIENADMALKCIKILVLLYEYVDLKLNLNATLKEQCIGTLYIADFLLYFLNKRKNFAYINYLGLAKPYDNINDLIIEISRARNWRIKVKDMNTNMHKEVYDLQRGAEKFVEGFRNGYYGKIVLDDLI